jgi:2-polyprenyl-3-methyl-5-hydroxy-6-metoxy-1,4-benzoquinol methylase
MRPCFICGGDSAVTAYAELARGAYLRCADCGLIYVARIESPERLHRSYTGGSWKSLRRRLVAPFRGFSHVRHFAQSMERARRIVRFAASLREQRIQRQAADRPALLDIGCNKGFLLAAAIEQGWNVWGVEAVPELTAAFRRQFRPFAPNVLSATFSQAQARLQDEAFDMITAIDMIEHFEEPEADLASIHRLLRPGGIFMLQTPDGGCEQAQSAGERWGALKPLEHLHIFNRRNLAVLLQRLGFAEIAFFEPFDVADGNLVGAARKGVA